MDGHQRGKVRRALADYMLHLPAEMMSRASIGGHMGLRCRKLSTPKCSLTTAAFRAEVGACDTRSAIHAGPGASELQDKTFSAVHSSRSPTGTTWLQSKETLLSRCPTPPVAEPTLQVMPRPQHHLKKLCPDWSYIELTRCSELYHDSRIMIEPWSRCKRSVASPLGVLDLRIVGIVPVLN